MPRAQAEVDVRWSGAVGLDWWAGPVAGWAVPVVEHASGIDGATRARAGAGAARAVALLSFGRLVLPAGIG